MRAGERAGFDLLNDLGTCRRSCSLVSGYPVQVEAWRAPPSDVVPTAPSREAIESGPCSWWPGRRGRRQRPRWMMARARGWLVFDWIGVHADRWSDAPRPLPRGRGSARDAGGRSCARRWRAAGSGPRSSSAKGSPARRRRRDAGQRRRVCHDGNLYIPDGETSGAPVEQLSSFTDEHDQFLDADPRRRP